MRINIISLLKILLSKIVFLLLISFSISHISISKLNKDILREFNNYKPAIFHNSTNFSCDNGSNNLTADKFNDDFCDCEDGADENRTNACLNGKFVCTNRFFEKKIIPTNRVNDGICDCCDGSDEFPNLNCQKTCLESSKKEFERLTENFNEIVKTVNGYSKDTIDNYFDKFQYFIEDEIYRYQHLTELKKKKFLLRSYLAKIENSLTEENPDFVDENGNSYKNILNSYNLITEKINVFEQELDKTVKERENLINFSIYVDLSNQLLKVNYKKYECEFNFSTLRCQKKDNWKNKHLGNYRKIEDNIIKLEAGDMCHYYNKPYNVRIYLECANTDSFEFVNKYEGCSLEFVYKSAYGCNSIALDNMLNRINLLTDEI